MWVWDVSGGLLNLAKVRRIELQKTNLPDKVFELRAYFNDDDTVCVIERGNSDLCVDRIERIALLLNAYNPDA